MAAELETVDIDEMAPLPDLEAMSTDELVSMATQGHHNALKSASHAIACAIRVGEILLVVRERLEPGTRVDWIRENMPFSYDTGVRYMRLAHYRNEALTSGATSLYAAIDAVKPLPSPFAGPVHNKAPDPIREEVQTLREEGKTYQQIAETVGVSIGSVHNWMHPERAKKYKDRGLAKRRRDREARRVLEEKERRQERDRAAKRAGGAVSHAYSNLRKTLTHLQAAIDEAEDRGAEAALREAMGYMHKADDEIVRALGVQA